MDYTSVYQKLLAIQLQLKAPKNQWNKFNEFWYRNCEDILNAFKPLGDTYKALIKLSDEIVLIGERYYIKATALFVDLETGQTIESYAYAREEEKAKGKDASQITGSASSYARKYALNGLLAIDDTKDADGDDGDNPPPKPLTPRRKLILKLKELGLDATAYAEEKGLTKGTPDERYEELLKELEG